MGHDFESLSLNHVAPSMTTSTLGPIDNSKNLYIPVYLSCGVTVQCQPDVFLPPCRRIISVLQQDLSECFTVLPVSVHHWIRRHVSVWVNTTYATPSACGNNNNTPVHHICTHHTTEWLYAARDRPEKKGGVEIYNAEEYLRMRLHWNGCGLLLHELCHVIHDRVLGLDCLRVQRVYYKAKASGKYENVLRRDWAGKKGGERDLAYCMVDYKEFFAEMSVTYWSRGHSPLLDKAPAECVQSCTPPLQEPRVLARIGYHEASSNDDAGLLASIRTFFQSFTTEGHGGHCNKFYPFTSGQLLHHDPELFADMEAIWEEVIHWEDPTSNNDCSCFLLPPPLQRLRRPLRAKEGSGRKGHSAIDSLTAFTVIGDTVDL